MWINRARDWAIHGGPTGHRVPAEGEVSDNPRCSLDVLVVDLPGRFVIGLVVNNPCDRGGRSRRGNVPWNNATGHNRTGRLARGRAVLEAGLLGVDWRRA